MSGLAGDIAESEHVAQWIRQNIPQAIPVVVFFRGPGVCAVRATHSSITTTSYRYHLLPHHHHH